MGLDTTHDCWHGSYSAFNRWRNAIAEAAGYALVPGDHGQNIDLRWDDFARKNYDGDWDETPIGILLVLIVHSDCDGVIHPEHAGPLADRIEGLLPLLPPDSNVFRGPFHREGARKFIDGLRSAVAAGENVEFR